MIPKNIHYLDLEKSLKKKQFLFCFQCGEKGRDHLPYAFYSLINGTIIGHFGKKEKFNISTIDENYQVMFRYRTPSGIPIHKLKCYFPFQENRVIKLFSFK